MFQSFLMFDHQSGFSTWHDQFDAEVDHQRWGFRTSNMAKLGILPSQNGPFDHDFQMFHWFNYGNAWTTPDHQRFGGSLELSEIYGYTVYICIPSILQINFGDNAYWGYKQKSHGKTGHSKDFVWSPPRHVSGHIFWQSIWQKGYDLYSNILSDIILTFYLTLLLQIVWHSIWHIVWHSIWHIVWYSIWHKVWHSIWHILWNSIWHIKSDILSDIILTYSLAFYLTYSLTFYLTYSLTYSLTSYLTLFWHMAWHSIWHI